MNNTVMLMADIVKSQDLDQEYLSKTIRDLKVTISRECSEYLVSEIVEKIGDEFQCVCRDAFSAMVLIMKIDEYLLTRDQPIHCRFVVAEGVFFGEQDSAVGRLGEELSKAHESLHTKRKNRRRVSLEFSKLYLKKQLEDLFCVLDVIKYSWKEKDYKLIGRMISDETTLSIAEDLNKTQQQIKKRYKTLQIEGYIKLKKAIQDLSKINQ